MITPFRIKPFRSFATALVLTTSFFCGCGPVLETSKAPKDRVKEERAIQLEKAKTYKERQTASESVVITEEELGVIPKEQRFSQKRLWRVAFPLRAAGVGMFQGVENVHNFGLVMAQRDKRADYSVKWVAPNGPAEEAGLKEGDKIVAIGDKKASKISSKEMVKLLNPKRKESPFLRMTVQRDGEEFSVEMQAIEVLPYNVVLDTGKAINAYADGNKVVILKGMMEFAQSDDELAVVVGHELAHNGLGHVNKKMGNAALGAVLDIFLGSQDIDTKGAFTAGGALMFSQSFESEADYAGLYMVARAGYPITRAPYFWRRMGEANPSSIKGSFLSTHPSTPERFVSLEETVKELKAKQIAKVPLIPERREKKVR